MPEAIQTEISKNKPEIAVVVPVHNEQENLDSLIGEIRTALEGVTGNFEIIYVDDGSTDDTLTKLVHLQKDCPQLRVLQHLNCCGQSAAVITGVEAARAGIIATLDGDGQNDPADIPALLETLQAASEPDLLLVAGLRAKRKDTWVKRLSSKIANSIRGGLLKDNTPDTGCGLKVFTRRAFLGMPHFDHLHRFLPAMMIRQGGSVVSVPVNHRPRERGKSKYGTLDRAAVGIVDLFGVFWLQRRASLPKVKELDGPDKGASER